MGKVECCDVQENCRTSNLTVKFKINVISFVKLIKLCILDLILSYLGSLESYHETANQDQAPQLCFVDQDPGKYASPDEEAWHVGCEGRYVNVPHYFHCLSGYWHFNYN